MFQGIRDVPLDILLIYSPGSYLNLQVVLKAQLASALQADV